MVVTGTARRAHNGHSVLAIPDPGNCADALLFQTEAGVYRLRTVLVLKRKKERIFFLQPLPAGRDVNRNLDDYSLSKREKEVAIWAIRGLSNKGIAERLFICEQTVKDHLYTVFERMHIRRRSELAAKLLGLDQDEH